MLRERASGVRSDSLTRRVLSILLPQRPRYTANVAGDEAVSEAHAAYDAVVSALAEPTHAEAVQTFRRARESQTGAVDAEDEGFEARMRVFWDAAVTHPPLLEAALRDPKIASDARVNAWVGAFARAHRGLFRVRREHGVFVLDDVWSGAAFVLTPTPPRAMAVSLESTEGLFDGRVVGRNAPLAIALLPGALFHPADATDAIAIVTRAARERGLERDAALDALLRMEARLRAHTRVKPSYAYRPESLTS